MESSSVRPTARIAPSWKAGLAVAIGYAIIFTALLATSGIDYDELLRSPHSVFRGVLIPLLAGTAYLIAVTAWLRWDHVYSDPGRLPMSKLLWAPVVLMVIGGLIRLTGIPAGVPFDLIALILLAGILVGFAEETVFRGFFLRGLRSTSLPEIQIAVISSLTFGVFHLGNVFAGSPLGGVLFQVFAAAASGFVLYLARRGTGLLIAGMALHGFWDISTFLVETEADVTGTGVSVAGFLMFANIAFTLFVVFWVWRTQPRLKMSESGAIEGG